MASKDGLAAVIKTSSATASTDQINVAAASFTSAYVKNSTHVVSPKIINPQWLKPTAIPPHHTHLSSKRTFKADLPAIGSLKDNMTKYGVEVSKKDEASSDGNGDPADEAANALLDELSTAFEE
jgi:hypothetical protein